MKRQKGSVTFKVKDVKSIKLPPKPIEIEESPIDAASLQTVKLDITKAIADAALPSAETPQKKKPGRKIDLINDNISLQAGKDEVMFTIERQENRYYKLEVFLNGEFVQSPMRFTSQGPAKIFWEIFKKGFKSLQEKEVKE